VQTPAIEHDYADTPPIPLKELATILIKHYGYHEGTYEIGIQFNVAVGSVGPDPEHVAPGAVFTVAGIGLSRCADGNLLGVDAATVNPSLINEVKKKPARKKIDK
jgi:hypothetical protein